MALTPSFSQRSAPVAGPQTPVKLSFKPDADPLDLDPSEIHILDEIASVRSGAKVSADDYLAAAASGKTVREMASEAMDKKVRDVGMQLALKHGWMDPSDFKQAVRTEMAAMGIDVPEESLGSRLTMPTSGMSPETQDVAHATELAETFGDEAAMAVTQGTLTPELAAHVITRLDTPRYDQAMRVFEQLSGQAPGMDGAVALDAPNQWQIMAAALTAVLAPKYAYRAGMTPYQFMQYERERRQKEQDDRYRSEYSSWATSVQGAQDMAQTGLRADIADAQVQEGYRDKLFDLQKNRESAASREAVASAKNQTSLMIQQMKDTGKLSETEARLARQMLDAVTDPNTTSETANSIRSGFFNRFGWDPLAGGPAVNNYRERESESRVSLNYARLGTELERAGLTREQARKVATEADLLPAEFELDAWVKAADIRLKVADQRIKLAELDAKTAGDMADVLGKARDAMLSQAEALEKSAKDLDEAAAIEQDPDRANELRDAADAQRGKAARAREGSASYSKTLEVVNARLATSAPSSVDNGIQPFQGRYQNGRIPASELADVPGAKGHRARPDVADAMGKMIAAAKADGVEIVVSDSYRDYDRQVDVKGRKPGLAADPGKSNHGWGTTFDLSVGGYGSKTYKWLESNASRFGFANPEWARQGGSKPEPWHWEYTSAQPGQTAQIDRKGSSLASGAAEVGDLLGIEGDDTKVTMALAQGLVKGVKQLPTTESPRAGDVALIEDVPGKKYRPMLISAVTTEKGQVMVTFKGGGKEFKKPASSVRMHVYRKS